MRPRNQHPSALFISMERVGQSGQVSSFLDNDDLVFRDKPADRPYLQVYFLPDSGELGTEHSLVRRKTPQPDDEIFPSGRLDQTLCQTNSVRKTCQKAAAAAIKSDIRIWDTILVLRHRKDDRQRMSMDMYNGGNTVNWNDWSYDN